MILYNSQASAERAQWYLIQCKRGESFCLSIWSESQGYAALHPLQFRENGAASS